VKAEFQLSVARFDQLPPPHGSEVCILGRSNVGKSSFINHVFADHGLARVSKMPGKTTLANYYMLSDDSRWVDLPGYGYARAAKGEQVRWSALIEDYCGKRTNLKAGLWLLDVRHCGLEIDAAARRWLGRRRLPVLTILTKCDKLTRSSLAKQVALFTEAFELNEPPLTYSIPSEKCREAFWKRYEQWSGVFL